MLLGTAYAASVGGVGTLIGTPPNAILAGQLDKILGYEIGFVQWLLIGLPIVVVTLPLVWYLLTFRIYPPKIDDVDDARDGTGRTSVRGPLDTRGRRVAIIFEVRPGSGCSVASATCPRICRPRGRRPSSAARVRLLGVEGHQGLLYYVMVGLAAIPALVLADTMEWDELADIDWGTILLFGGGISLADALANTGTTEWIANTVFGGLTGMPVVLIIAAVVLVVVFLTEMTSNTATTTILSRYSSVWAVSSRPRSG